MHRFTPSGRLTWLAALVICLLVARPAAALADGPPGSAVSVYPALPLPASTEFTVTANGAPISVVNAGTFRCAPFAFSGSVTLQITYQPGPIKSYQINPLSKHVTARQNGNTLTFTLDHPQSLEVQINGATSQVVDGDKLLYLFADAPETDAPQPTDSSVIYFGPGRHQTPNGELKIDDSDPHSALYLAPGALLEASVTISRRKPFKVYGRGFIRNPATVAQKKLHHAHGALNLYNCVGLVAEDVTFFDSIEHGITFSGGHDSVVRNVRALHYVVNSDGIAFLNNATRNTVEDSFIVGNDNLIVIGGGRDLVGPSHNLIRRCTFIKSSYAGNWGFPQGDGPIGPGNVTEDCDVVRCNGEVGLIRMFWAKPTTMDNLVFQDIRVQSLAGYEPNPAKSHENRFLSLESAGEEYPRTMTLKNIVLPSLTPSYVAAGKWTLIFDHVSVAGKIVTSDADLQLTKGDGVVTRYLP